MFFMMLHSNSTTNLGWNWYHACTPYQAFYFCGWDEVCGCSRIFKNCTRAVQECAKWKANVRRVCGCAQIRSAQILWRMVALIYNISLPFCIYLYNILPWVVPHNLSYDEYTTLPTKTLTLTCMMHASFQFLFYYFWFGIQKVLITKGSFALF